MCAETPHSREICFTWHIFGPSRPRIKRTSKLGTPPTAHVVPENRHVRYIDSWISNWVYSGGKMSKILKHPNNLRIIIIGIQPLGRFGHRPELSQSTGIALVRCILGKFLGVVCHCFPPRLDIPTFATRCLNDARDPSGGRWNCGRECCPVSLPKWQLPHHLGIFYMPQIYDMGPMALLPLRRKACWGFFRP